MEFIEGSVTAPAGFTAGGIHCGIRHNRARKDLAMILCEKPCDAAAVYTSNKVKGAPIRVTQEHLQDGKARAVICNSGIANTCNRDGVEKAKMMCEYAAAALGIDETDMIVASTGVIGQELPIEPVRDNVAALVRSLSRNGAEAAEEAIMTTDTRKKQVAVQFELGGHICRIGGMAKGSGMINPNMATMLCFITTDANIEAGLLHKALLDAIQDSFNMVCVDGDTSTNDTVAVMASGLCGNPRITQEDESFDTFHDALAKVCLYISREIARDGEGATKLVECRVTGAPDDRTARALAKSVIASNLVKAAMFGSDANWGRVLCALGYAGVEVDPEQVDVAFESIAGKIDVCRRGGGLDFSEDDARTILMRNEVRILVELHAGDCAAIAFGCDLTYDYVKINGDYRT